ncbi:right-handed parallel beta-helix repeat-containing protein, partial [Ralstonia pseudosolanacearum]|uniref:right-handed parallel beta-helix repeat-containing protein n=1 Tax=Ralstonia pseudosolanacearum TaxID=1310165 RepID=UPI003D2DB614
VKLEDFGTGHHYRVKNVYVHHLCGMLKNSGSGENLLPAKKTGGIQFRVTRDNETATRKGRPTNFKDVVVENSEIFHVDLVGLSTWSDWMCRDISPPCKDYKPYSNGRRAVTAESASDYFPSEGIVFRNNKIHGTGGDGVIVRASTDAQVVANLVYDVWMRAPGNSAGLWIINSDGAMVQYNEVHKVRQQIAKGDGNAFDADMGARNTTFQYNYSHDNAGGLMLFCGCGGNELGKTAQSVGTKVKDNLSVNDKRRIFFLAGSTDSEATGNTVVIDARDNTPLVEVGSQSNAVRFSGNKFYNFSGAGEYYFNVAGAVDYRKLSWDRNLFFGFLVPGGANPGVNGTNV